MFQTFQTFLEVISYNIITFLVFKSLYCCIIVRWYYYGISLLSYLITVKNGVNAPIKTNAPGRLDLFIFIEKRPRYVENAPERCFSRFFERKTPWGEPTTREGVRKGPAA